MLFKVIQSHIHEMNSINLATSFHRVAKLASSNHDIKLHEVKKHACFVTLLDEISRQISNHLACVQSGGYPKQSPQWSEVQGQVPVQCLSIVAWSCASLRIRNETLFGKITAILVPRLTELKPFELSNLVWAYAKLQLVDTELLKAVTERLLSRQEGEFKVQCLSTIAWCFATTRFRHVAVFASLAEELVAHASEAKPQEISTTLWAFAKNRHSSPMLFEAFGWVALTDSKIAHFKLQELSNTAWAFATAGLENVALFAQIERAVQSKLSGIEPQSIANILWAFAKLQVPLQTNLFDSLLKLTMSKQSQFKPEELSAVIWAAAQTCPDFVDFFDATMQACVQRLSEFSVNAVANLVKTFSAVQTSNPGLFISLLQHSLAHLEELRPASLCSVLQGAVIAAGMDIYAAQKPLISTGVPQICNEIANMRRMQEFKRTEIQLISAVLHDPRTRLLAPKNEALEQALALRASQILVPSTESEESGEYEDSSWPSSSGSDTDSNSPKSKDGHSGARVQPQAPKTKERPFGNPPCSAPKLPKPIAPFSLADALFASDTGAKVAQAPENDMPWKIPTPNDMDQPWKVPLPCNMQAGSSPWMQADAHQWQYPMHAGFTGNSSGAAGKTSQTLLPSPAPFPFWPPGLRDQPIAVCSSGPNLGF